LCDIYKDLLLIIIAVTTVNLLFVKMALDRLQAAPGMAQDLQAAPGMAQLLQVALMQLDTAALPVLVVKLQSLADRINVIEATEV
jgi:hypothetical protein